MYTKKSLFKSLAAVILACTPLFAYSATLDVINNTDEDSTVRIYQSGLCSGRGHMTPAHGSSKTAKAKVKMLCLLAKKCDAVMYASDNCSGNPVAHLSLNTDTLDTTIINIDNPRYTVIANGNEVIIGYS